MLKKSFFKKIKNRLFSLQKTDLIFLFFFFVAGWLIYNLYILQVIKGDYYNDKILAQNNNYSNSNVFYRGDIYFQNKDSEVLVATQKNGWILAINPKVLKNSETIFEKLNKITEIDKKDFLRKVGKKNDPYEEIKSKLSDDEYRRIKKLNLKGVILAKESWRYYPFGSVASKILGFLDVNKSGVYGLEKFYENILKRDYKIEDRNIFWRLFSENQAENLFSQKNISKEGDLISSLDIEIQQATESVIKKIDEKYKSEYSAAIIMRSATGEIVAMADTKNFDLNNEKKDYRNEFVEYVFEVGSILKPLVVAIGLETNSVDMNFSYTDVGCLRIQGYKICNFDKKARGKGVDLYEIIAKSLNLGMVEVGKRIGHKKLFEYFLELGLAEETGIDLVGEVPSNISALNDDIEINYATAAFGQGVAFTPIGIIRALNTIASDGFLIEPHLVKEINYGDLIPSKVFTPEKKQVFSPQTIKNIKDILIKRSSGSSLEKKYVKNGYSVATKTGTAQIAKAGGYDKHARNHFFFGFFPAQAKVEDRYTVLLFTVRPQGVRYSATSLSKPFYEIANFIISNKNIKPDRPTLEF